MACRCIEALNQVWSEHGHMVDTALWMDLETQEQTVTVRIKSVVTQPKKGRKAEVIMPTYCPFCGVAYKPPKTGEENRG